jgi:hypothetical protein
VSVLLGLALPAAASADTYCVNKPACSGVVHASVQAALDAAKVHPGDDVVEIGPSSGPYIGPFGYFDHAVNNNDVSIVGAGREQTVLLGTANHAALSLGENSSVSHLSLKIPPGEPGAIGLNMYGTYADDIAVIADGAAADAQGIVGHNVSVISDSIVQMPAGTGVVADGGVKMSVNDSVVSAPVGLSSRPDATLSANRVRIDSGSVGATAEGSSMALASALVTTSGADAIGVRVGNDAVAALKHVTISRSSPAESTGPGVFESAVGLVSTAGLDIERSTIDGYATPLLRRVLYGASSQLDASYSNFDLDDVDLDSEPGVTLGPWNINQPPQFVAPGFHPRAGSALIDSAGTCAPSAVLDLGLGERCVDGDGLGGPQADIGAYEYQRAEPVADFVAGTAVAGSPVPFDAGSSSDPDPGDGSQLTYAWAFGDGQGGSGRTPSHVYAQPDDYEVTLMVVDPTGRPASVTRVVSVAAAPAVAAAPSGPASSADTVAPVISALRVWPKRRRVGFRLSEPARVTLRFASARTGRRRGILRMNGRAGVNSVRFAGRLSRSKTLRPGPYRLAVLAADGAGNRAATKRARFTLLPRR